MFITGLGTATPARRYGQRECWELVRSSPSIKQLSSRSRALLRTILTGQNGIDQRYLALESLERVFAVTPDTMQERFSQHAPALACQAARRALEQAQAEPSQIEGLVVSTCTGYLCPGLTSYLAEMLGLPNSVLALDLVGQGCGAAVPNLRTADAMLRSGCRQVLSVCVEVCSAAFYLDDDPGVLVSACLFGDGAAAAVLSLEPGTVGRKVEWKTASSILIPANRELLRFETKGGLLRNRLSPCVPRIAAKSAKAVFDSISGSRTRDEITTWLFHAGGREVLAQLQLEFALQEGELHWSKDVLRQYGNLSSPFVLFVLQAALAGGAPSGKWWLSSFGAGFSAHGALLEVSDRHAYSH